MPTRKEYRRKDDTLMSSPRRRSSRSSPLLYPPGWHLDDTMMNVGIQHFPAIPDWHKTGSVLVFRDATSRISRIWITLLEEVRREWLHLVLQVKNSEEYQRTRGRKGRTEAAANIRDRVCWRTDKIKKTRKERNPPNDYQERNDS